jgi:hypothetical protein
VAQWGWREALVKGKTFAMGQGIDIRASSVAFPKRSPEKFRTCQTYFRPQSRAPKPRSARRGLIRCPVLRARPRSTPQEMLRAHRTEREARPAPTCRRPHPELLVPHFISRRASPPAPFTPPLPLNLPAVSTTNLV